MRRILTMIAATAMLAGAGLGMSAADPGPHHGNNKKGLCTAYFNGSEKGQEQKRKAGPFVALEAAAEAQDQTVEEFCGDLVGGRAGREGGEE